MSPFSFDSIASVSICLNDSEVLVILKIDFMFKCKSDQKYASQWCMVELGKAVKQVKFVHEMQL